MPLTPEKKEKLEAARQQTAKQKEFNTNINESTSNLHQDDHLKKAMKLSGEDSKGENMN